MRSFRAVAFFALALIGVAWSRAAAVESPAVAETGTVVGEIRFNEAVPKPEKLFVNRDADVCGVTKQSESFLVSPTTKGLKNVVLSVEGVSQAPAAQREQTVQIIQSHCTYEPHVLVAQLGVSLQITNRDNTLHNIHSYLEPSKKTLFNLAQPIQNQVTKVMLKDEGVISVKCDVHNWMSAFVVVKKHPYFALSDANGAFRIANVPAGRYKLQAWHEELGTTEKEVTVTAGQESRVTFEIGK